jgi:hypothetical protein
VARYRADGELGLLDRSSAPKSISHRTSEQRVHAIAALRSRGSLRDGFGVAPLIGKPLAVIADARLSGRDSPTVVERPLSISGEDLITVNIK